MTGPDGTAIERAADVLEFLSQSDTRVTVLVALSERGRLDRYELEAEVDVTRRTILRTVNALVDRGYVEEHPDGLGLTALGELVVGHYEAFADAVALDPAVEECLAAIPADAIGVDVDRLRDGTVTTAAPGDPFAALDRALELRAEATEVRELAPGIERRSVEQLADRVEGEDGIDVEIVLTEAVVAAAEDVPYGEAHETVLAADAVDMRVHPGPFEVALGIADEVVFVVAEGADGQPSAILESDDAAVRRWAEAVIDRYREGARPIDSR